MEKTITCMLIDDDSDEHEIFREALCQTLLPISCIFAFDCPGAIILMNSTEKSIPEFIFMDWNLGGIQGIDCLNELYSFIPTYCQIIIYSGQIPQVKLDGLDKYKCCFLQKSGSITSLANELKLILEMSRAI